MNDSTTMPEKHLATLNTFRACRLHDYTFIAKTPYESLDSTGLNGNLQGEIIQLLHLPFFRNDTNIHPLVKELKLYHELSKTLYWAQKMTLMNLV